jgi:arginine repressor
LFTTEEFMKQNKMAAVRELLSSNPDATPTEIVAALAKQKIEINEGVASNYKSVIKAGAKRKGKKGRRVAAPATSSEPEQAPAPISPVSRKTGLDPAVVDLLKAGKALGWDKVRSIVELMG